MANGKSRGLVANERAICSQACRWLTADTADAANSRSSLSCRSSIACRVSSVGRRARSARETDFPVPQLSPAAVHPVGALKLPRSPSAPTTSQDPRDGVERLGRQKVFQVIMDYGRLKRSTFLGLAGAA